MRKQDLILWALCALFMFSGCGLSRKVTKTEKSAETSEKTTESTSESTSNVKETAPTESEIVFDIKDFEQMIDGFTQRISSGNGSASEITKQDGKLYVRNTTGGTRDAETTSATTAKETTYNTEYVIKESKKLIRKLPWWFWGALIIWLIIVFRKFIAQILVIFFPASALLKIFSGSKP